MQEPNTPPNVVEVSLPPGMTKEAFLKSFSSYEKMRDYTAKRDKAVRRALNTLKDAHIPEYTKYLGAELKKVGLPVK